MRQEKKHYSAEEKVPILKRHLLDKVPVSALWLGYRTRGLNFQNGRVERFSTCEID